MNKLRFALIGCGSIAKKHAHVVSQYLEDADGQEERDGDSQRRDGARHRTPPSSPPARLKAAASAGILRYGLHRQDAAMMTCFTPSVMRSDHVHFIDGARGGYATAATALKASAA